MEWGRAKSILIIAFVLLNVLLLVQLRDNAQDVSVQNISMSEFSEDIRKRMVDRNIQINTNMPAVSGRLKEITVTYAQPESGPIIEPLKNPVAVSGGVNNERFESAIERQLANLDMADYQYDALMTGRDTLYYHQLYEGLPMFEVNLKLLTDKRQVIAVERDRVTIDVGAEQEIISSYVAVSTLIENYLENGSVVNQVQLGYHGQMFDSQRQFLTPFWRVSLADGRYYYVHAINGSVEAEQKQIEGE